MRVQHLQRDDFLTNYCDIAPGEHVNVVGPTGAGKTHLLMQMLRLSMKRYPWVKPVCLAPKPSDATMDAWAESLGLKHTPDWPSRKKFWESQPAGHVLCPAHIRDDETRNRAHIGEVFKRGINDLYWSGNSITFIDDAYLAGVTYGLNPELDRHWIAGRSSNAGLWTSLQKPSGSLQGAVSSFAYDAPTHMFFGRDNDQRNLKRISEMMISQLDPVEIQNIIRHLPVRRIGNSAVSDMLYIDRRGPYLATIGI